MGKTFISKRKNGEFQFNLKANNGQIVLYSDGYKTQAACSNRVESVKKNAPGDSRYNKLDSKNSKYYFNLKAANRQVIGTSEMYERAAGRDKGIVSVKNNTPEADVVIKRLKGLI